MKRFYFLFTCLLSCVCMHAATSGSCGDNLQWNYRASDSTLIITGSGPMSDVFTSSYYANPFSPYNLHIKHIELPEGLTRIASHAFTYCNEVAELVIPDSVVEIASGALNSMTGLKKLTLGSQLQIIGDNACGGLNVDTLISNATFDTWCRSSFHKDGGIVRMNKALIIDGQQVTGDFYLPNTVHRINDNVFCYCPGLTAMHIPASVDTIGQAFGTVFKDEIYYFEGTLEQWCNMVHTNSLRFTVHTLYINGDDLSDLVLPEGMTTVSPNTFHAVRNIEHLTLPSSLTSVGRDAFYACTGLKVITGGENIRCYEFGSFGECESLHSYAIPRETRYIGEKAFWVTPKFRGTIRLDSITYLGIDAFADCGIDSVFLPDCLTSLNTYTFGGCPYLRYVRLPRTITALPSSFFKSDTALHTITLPSTLQTIGNVVFYGSGLEELTLPENVTSIGSSALGNIPSMQQLIVLPATPPSCDANLLWNVDAGRVQVTVPCEAIGAYRNATGWKEITHYLTNPSIGSSVFSSNNTKWGTISIEQECANITLSAIPKDHYHFVVWSNGETANPYSFTQVSDTAVQAIFEIDRYRIAFLNADSSVIYVDSAVYNTMPVYAGSAPVHPTEPERYRFYGWKPATFARATKDTAYIALYSDLHFHYKGLCFHAVENSSFSWRKNYQSATSAVQVSRDGQHWENMGYFFPRVIAAGDSLFIRAIGNTPKFEGYFRTEAGRIMASGSVMSLIDTTLTRKDVPDEAFMILFSGCNHLYTAPELPATTVGRFAYDGMFSNCKNLRAAPYLPATNLSESAYYGMFAGCDSLRYVEAAFTRWTDSQNKAFTDRWLDGVADSGLFVAPAALPLVIDSCHVPQGWTLTHDTTSVSVAAKADHGRVFGVGRYHTDYPVTLAVIPEQGHTFLTWHIGSDKNPLFVTASHNATYYAFCPADTSLQADTTQVMLLDDAALICWQMVDSATRYQLTGYADGVEQINLLLDTYGQPIDGNAEVNSSYAPLRKRNILLATQSEADYSPLVIRYYWSNLLPGATYTYSVNAYRDDTLLKTITGRFAMPVETVTSIDPVSIDRLQQTGKFLRNGQIFILRGEKVYTLTGQEVK